MYLPAPFHETDIPRLHGLIRAADDRAWQEFANLVENKAPPGIA